MSNQSTFAKRFGANLATVVKHLILIIGAVIFSASAACFAMAPSLVGQYIVYGVIPLEQLTMANPPSAGLTHPIWIAQYVWWFVGFPVMWAAGKAYLEGRK